MRSYYKKNINYNWIKGLILLIIGSFFLSACATTTPPPPITKADLAPCDVAPLVIPTSKPKEGSLFRPGMGVSLVSDFRARRIGDVVTIKIVENLKGSKDVKTQRQRQSQFNIGLSGLLGLNLKKGVSSLTGFDPSQVIGGSTNDKFNGNGQTSRNTSLVGTISARVVKVLPGGNLVIRGVRQLRINDETQYLVITGIARPQDIAPDNTILSTRLADARIEYTGGGVLSEDQKPGWLARILGAISPF